MVLFVFIHIVHTYISVYLSVYGQLGRNENQRKKGKEKKQRQREKSLRRKERRKEERKNVYHIEMHIYARKRMYIHKYKRIYHCWSLTPTLYYSALYRLSVPIFLSQDGDDARVNDVSILLLSVYLLLQPLLFILLTSPHLCSSSYIFSSHPF